MSYTKRQFGDSLSSFGVEKSRFPKEAQGLVQQGLKMGGRHRKAKQFKLWHFVWGGSKMH